MAIQKKWDKYEAAILLDYYMQYLNERLSRKEVIQIVSEKLRELAKTRNIIIDNVYRNINGITFQMHSMESAYKGYTVVKPASKLFAETVKLFKDDKKQFDKLLEEAKQMINTTEKDNRDCYLDWLSNKVTPAQLSELYMSYEAIDEFCIKTKVLKYPLLETTDINIIRLVQKTVEQNKVFRFQHKREINRVSSAMRYYLTYIGENSVDVSDNVILSEKRVTKNAERPIIQDERDKRYADMYPLIYKKVFDSLKESKKHVGDRGATVASIYENIRKIARCETIKEILDNVSWAYCDESKHHKNRYHFSETKINKESVNVAVADSNLIEKGENDKSDTAVKIKFAEISDLSYTRPVCATYFGDEIQDVSSWKRLYVNVFKKIYEDYDYSIPINRSFNAGKGRMDFCTSEYYNSMIAPKEIVNGKYLETNLSATDIIRKIKCLLDICLVDEENLIIRYVKKENVKSAENIKAQKSLKSNVNTEGFYNWLSGEQQMALPTCRSYVSAVNTAERYAKDNGFSNCKLYTDNYQEAKLTAAELFDNKAFVDRNAQQHNRFRAGINKLLLYIEHNETPSPSIELEPFAKILVEGFPRGYRKNSPLELRKFKRYWEDIHDSPIDMDDNSIVNCIEHCGVVYDEKVYMPQKMLDDDTRMKLFSYIKNSFQTGKSAIYYEALFNEFSDDFLDHCMYNASMLKTYLTYMNDGSYCVGKDFISEDANINVDPYYEIKNCLVQKSAPMGYDEMFAILSHIPGQKIKTILAQYDEFISNGRGEYFHISSVTISDDDLENIELIIQNSIDEKRFISGNELIDDIKGKFPYIIEQNTLFLDKGLRDAIGYKLKNKFSFKGNVISSKEQALSMMEVFADYCKHKDSFTLEELKMLKQELGTAIYFEAVYGNSLRISKNEFVAKDYACFKTEETDAAIDRFCSGDYIAIGKIKSFGLFPDAGFNWNSFLLEHYIAMYSPNYKLVHSGYNEGVCVGGIVKKLSHIDTFDELVIDVLAKSGLSLQKETALQYLCDEGYLARRNYSGIEQLLIKAKELRNQEGL